MSSVRNRIVLNARPSAAAGSTQVPALARGRGVVQQGRRVAAGLLLWPLAALLGGCATLSADECHNANWRDLGHTEGAQGYRMTRFREHIKACSAHGVSPVLDDYLKGHRAGLAQWCERPSAGFERGRSGGDRPEGLCEPTQARAILAAWEHGHGVRQAELDYERAERDYEQARHDLYRIEGEVDRLRLALIHDEGNPEHRREQLNRLDYLRARAVEESFRLQRARRDALRAQAEYDRRLADWRAEQRRQEARASAG